MAYGVNRNGPISDLAQSVPGIHYDGDGRGRKQAYCNSAVTSGTAYVLGGGDHGCEAEAIGAAGTNVLLGVADKAYATGAFGWFIVEGEVDLTTASDAIATVGYAFKVHTDGTIICTDAAFDASAENEFAVGTQVEATATTHTVYMLGRHITWA